MAAVSTVIGVLVIGPVAELQAQISAPSSSVRVRSGDTLESLALRHGTSVAALQQANPGINPLALQVGQQLRLPPPQGLVRIKAGDTLEAIALRHGTSMAALRQANPGVKAEALPVGQWLRLPNGPSAPASSSARPSPAPATPAASPGPDPKADPEAQAALLLSPGARRDRAALTLRERSGQVRWRRFNDTLIDWSGWQLHPGGVRITLVQPAVADVGARRSGATALAVQCSSLRHTWRIDGAWERWSSPAAGSVAQRIVLQLCSNTLDGPAVAIPPPPDTGS
ncbi:MAG: LysM peptidoglycan-binding domain-containing protein [Cyanobacteriota bacterium]|nr:LysM peptidoglycan-binding domain-containing protein [Cyanobacteriota bacterium]